MAKANGQHTEALVERLAHSLRGTHGRTVSVASLRSLAEIEVAEWRFDQGKVPPVPNQYPSITYTSNRYDIPLISGSVKLTS
jgi:hypothetical protein